MLEKNGIHFVNQTFFFNQRNVRQFPFFLFYILSEAFIESHKSSKAAGCPFSLKVFISGRNRLEDPGAKSLSEAFKVQYANLEL